MKLLFLSTPIAPLGSGLGGGIELTLYNIAREMIGRGHEVQVMAPSHSILPNIGLITISGSFQASTQHQPRETPICLSENAVLANMWDYVRQIEQKYDLILNFAYDWLPLYLTPFYRRPVAHLISMASMTEAMDRIIQQTFKRFPHLVAFHTLTQAATFGITESCYCMGNGIDLSLYQFCEHPSESLAWVGRISPEKGLEDAIAAAQQTGMLLNIFGAIQDRDYWQYLQQTYPHAPIKYHGFLPNAQLQMYLRQCKGFLMTHRLIESFGNVVIEALACGVPVIAYRRGGPAEIVRDGETGFLVEPDSVTGLVEGIEQLDKIDRGKCRQQAEDEYSLAALGDRYEKWFTEILTHHLTV